MSDMPQLETLIGDAIVLLTESGFPLAADMLRDNLRSVRNAPTAGARRHRLFQLRELFDGMGSGADVFFCAPAPGLHGIRFSRTDAHRRDEQRYRRTLASIQEILAAEAAA
jgi:hypothetical protein